MIIGKGSIAKLLNDRVWFILYAAGAGNSSHVTEADVIRESLDLGKWIKKSHDEKLMFVYFGSISIFYADTQYTQHKRNMEKVVRTLAENYAIVRLGNIWECTNPNTFLNAFKANPDLVVRDEYKYMISQAQLMEVVNGLRARGQFEISVFGEMLKVSECLKQRSSRLPLVTSDTLSSKQG